MEDTREVQEVKLGLRDLGAVSEQTRGDIYKWPWYENTPPPFSHICPICYDDE